MSTDPSTPTAPAGTTAADGAATPDLSADPAVRRTMRLLTSVVAPATLLTSLLYYFGWTEAHASANYLGIDESVLGFTTQDYLLRSVNAVFWPLAVGLIVAALALRGHVTVMRAVVHTRHQRHVQVVAGVVALLGLIAVVYGSLALHHHWIFRGDFSIAPLCLTAGAAAIAYAFSLFERAHVVGNPHASTGAGSSSLAVFAVAMLIGVGLFWQVAEWANSVGVGKTRDLVAHLDSRPSVTLYSAKRLQLDGKSVTETSLPSSDSAYLYRYDGLRLLLRSGGKYLLLSDQWNRVDGRTFVIDDTAQVRLEFTPGR
ncbi:MAG: hypothetical protein ACJ735_07515 [Actinomycetes bacterium]